MCLRELTPSIELSVIGRDYRAPGMGRDAVVLVAGRPGLCAGDMRLSLTGRRLALPVPGRV
jgi:hypothetical protein